MTKLFVVGLRDPLYLANCKTTGISQPGVRGRHLQHEMKQLLSVSVPLQILSDEEIQNAEWLRLYVQTLRVL